MAKPYSNDLRARVVNDIAEGATLAETADHHHVSLSSVVRFLRLKRNTGNIGPTKFGGYKPYSLAAHEKLVRRLVAQQPDITLAEIRAQLTKQKIKVGQSSIFRFLRHLKLTVTAQEVCLEALRRITPYGENLSGLAGLER